MNHHNVELPSEVSSALAAIRIGIVSVGVSGRVKGMDRFFGCDLELTSGQVITICADQSYPEHRFEVFPIKAELSSDLRML